MKVNYRIVNANRKIYVGKGLTGSANCIGSTDSRLIEEDFSAEKLRSFTIGEPERAMRRQNG